MSGDTWQALLSSSQDQWQNWLSKPPPCPPPAKIKELLETDAADEAFGLSMGALSPPWTLETFTSKSLPFPGPMQGMQHKPQHPLEQKDSPRTPGSDPFQLRTCWPPTPQSPQKAGTSSNGSP